jgi:hypothetical protein
MLIDCDSCQVRGPACGDCVVPVLLGAPPALPDTPGEADGVDLDGAERAAIAVLARCGLVPPLRLVPGAGAPDRPVHDESDHREAEPRRRRDVS